MKLQRITTVVIWSLAVASVLFIGAAYASADTHDSGSSYGSQSQQSYGNGMMNGNDSITVTLLGSNEVPPVSTQTSGTFTVTPNQNGTGDYTLDVMNGDNITGAHLHCALPGANGPIVVGLYNNASGVDINGRLTSGNISSVASTAADCAGTIGYAINNVNDLHRAAMEGKIYVNIHDTAHPSGVARAQIPVHTDSSQSSGGMYGGGGYDNHDSSYDSHDSDYDSHDSDYDSNDSDYGDNDYSDHSGYNSDNDYDHNSYSDNDKKDYGDNRDYDRSDYDKNDSDRHDSDKSCDEQSNHDWNNSDSNNWKNSNNNWSSDNDWQNRNDNDDCDDNHSSNNWSDNHDSDKNDSWSRDDSSDKWSDKSDNNDWDKNDSSDWSDKKDSDKRMSMSNSNWNNNDWDNSDSDNSDW